MEQTKILAFNEKLIEYAFNKKIIIGVILANIFLFHLDKLIFNIIVIGSFLIGFCFYNLNNQQLQNDFDDYIKKFRQKSKYPKGFIKIVDPYLMDGLLAENDDEFFNDTNTSSPNLNRSGMQQFKSFDQRSIQNMKPSLTGSYMVDDELHMIIELFIRDYVDSWYKTNISSKDDFTQLVRLNVYNAIRHFNLCLKSLDCEHFLMNILAHNLVIQMRILKKSKEKVSSASNSIKNNIMASSILNSDTNSSAKLLLTASQSIAAQNESNLIDTFFDLEAEIEKNVCRDQISYNSLEKEQELLQELSEILCYSFLSPRVFNCYPLRCLIRELLSNFLLKISIDNLTDPDYINQSILYLCQDQTPQTENFLTTINNCENVNELNELLIKIEDEILKTRSCDKGGHNDQEIKLKLSSLQYVRRRIDSCMNNLTTSLTNTKSSIQSNNTSVSVLSNSFADDEYRTYIFQQHLNNLDFSVVVTNEDIQHCFIEYMGKHNVQNLISFYLNADMYRQFAKKEMSKLLLIDLNSSRKETEDNLMRINDSKETLKDFAKGLIHSYLLNASNFAATTQDLDDKPINIMNHMFYKAELAQAIDHMDNHDTINETLLDELQAKIYLLMKQKYYQDFKQYPEFHKQLNKNDLIFKLVSTSTSTINTAQQSTKTTRFISNPIILSQYLDNNNTQSNDEDLINASVSDLESSFDSDSNILVSLNDETQSNQSGDNLSQSSFDFCTSDTNFNLTAIITSSGRCNDLKSTYAIYIIDVTKEFTNVNTSTTNNNNKNEFWQTYRRFNDFHDLHLILKRKFPNAMQNLSLPTKSLRTNLNDEFLEKRRIELNKYLQNLCNPHFLSTNPQVMPFILKFLENRKWENSRTNFKRRVDSILSPMITSVHTIQTSIKNAPDNVIGMVKGISDNILTNTVDTFNKINPVGSASSTLPNSQSTSSGFSTISSNNFSSSTISSPNSVQSSSNLTNSLKQSSSNNINNKSKLNQNELNLIDRTILNDEIQSNQLPVRVVLLLIDEIFDLKEKNQWLRQSLMAIVKSIMKNFRGDSMNRKIKEQIADYLSEEYVARYLKNFRKRIWPKGVLADNSIEQTSSAKEIRKILVKTKLLALVSDELRHILGNDTMRRGIFDLFDLFQHKPLNKRFLYVLIENLLGNFLNQSTSLTPPSSTTPNHSIINSPSSSSFTLNLIANNNMPLSPVNSIQLTTNTHNQNQQSNYNFSPLTGLIRLHLTKSSKVKLEWKLNYVNCKKKKETSSGSISNSSSINFNSNKSNSNLKSSLHRQSTLTSSTSTSSFINSMTMPLTSLTNNLIPSSNLISNNNQDQNTIQSTNNTTTNNNSNNTSSANNMTRSKSLFSEIQC